MQNEHQSILENKFDEMRQIVDGLTDEKLEELGDFFEDLEAFAYAYMNYPDNQ